MFESPEHGARMSFVVCCTLFRGSTDAVARSGRAGRSPPTAVRADYWPVLVESAHVQAGRALLEARSGSVSIERLDDRRQCATLDGCWPSREAAPGSVSQNIVMEAIYSC